MKKMTYFVMVLSMVLGFTQCKKEQTPANNETEGVFITLDVNGGNNGSRVIVDPTGNNGEFNYATVTFEDGDVIYVGNAGAYCGYLTFNGTNFTGTVNPTSTADYLHFYFMGNKGPVGSAPSTVSITDQTVKYPVISYAHSKDLFDSDVHSYTAKLQNYCSIVKFTTNSIPTATAVTVKGMKNTVAVNFGANNAATSTSGSPYTFTKSGDGDIILHAVSTSERWAILLEQDAVNGATVSASGYNNGTCNVPGITNNMYYTTGVDITLAAADYVFSVGETAVHFSPGNLQYKEGVGWQFAEHQYDYIGVWDKSDWVDLFGWGTWGEEGNPLNDSEEDEEYEWSDFQGTLDGHSDWRTLTSLEWDHLLNERNAPVIDDQVVRYIIAYVDAFFGLVVFPDSYTHPAGVKNPTDFDPITDNYSLQDWARMEAAGAVFLPAAGYRSGYDVYDGGVKGHYWSSSASDDNYDYGAWYAHFSASNVGVYEDEYIRCEGYSVRLVR